MTAATSVLLGSLALAAAFACVLAKTHSDVQPEESTSAKSKPLRVRSIQDEADGQRHRKSPVHHARSAFLTYLDKLVPNTDFDDPGDGYFQGYLHVRNAEEMRDLSDVNDVNAAVTEHFEKAYAFFLGVQRSAPGWKVDMVRTRLEKTRDSLKDAYLARNTSRAHAPDAEQDIPPNDR